MTFSRENFDMDTVPAPCRRPEGLHLAQAESVGAGGWRGAGAEAGTGLLAGGGGSGAAGGARRGRRAREDGGGRQTNLPRCGDAVSGDCKLWRRSYRALETLLRLSKLNTVVWGRLCNKTRDLEQRSMD
jgi:hypothetical protein